MTPRPAALIRFPLLALAVALAALPARAQDLRVLNWSDYIAPGLVEAFETETGLEVRYDIYESGETVESMLLAGGSGYDLVVVSSEYLPRLVEADAIGTFDAAMLPGLDGVDAAVMAQLGGLAPDGLFAIPYLYGTTGLGFDPEAVARLAPDAPTDSWSLLFDPRHAARLAECGVGIVDSPEEALAAALIWLGRDPAAASARDLEDAFAALAAIAPHVSVFDSAMMEPLAADELCLVLGWSVDVISVQAEAHEGVALSYVTPREGGLIWVDAFALPSDAQALEAAHAFVDFMLRPENSAAAADHSWAPSAVTAARALMDPEIAEHPAVYPQSGAAARLRAVRPQRAVSKAGIALDWSRVKLGEAPWE